MTTEMSSLTNVEHHSSLDKNVHVCFANVERPLVMDTIITLFLVVISACHLIVIIVCVRERKKASYKQDIVYMVALAMVDMSFCLSAIILQNSDVGLKNSVAIRSLPIALLCMSIMLLAIRAIERCTIFTTQKSKPWSFRFQSLLCVVSNIFVAIPITYLNYLTSVPFVAIFYCSMSLIILPSYATIVWTICTQARKNMHTYVSRTTLFRRPINVIDIDPTLKPEQPKQPQNMVTDQNTGRSQNTGDSQKNTDVSQIPRTNMVNNNLVTPDNGTDIPHIPCTDMVNNNLVTPDNGTDIPQIPRTNMVNSSLVPPDNGTDIPQIPRTNMVNSSLVPPDNGTDIPHIPRTDMVNNNLVTPDTVQTYHRSHVQTWSATTW